MAPVAMFLLGLLPAAAVLATPTHALNLFNQSAVTMPLPPLSDLMPPRPTVTVKTLTVTSDCPDCQEIYVTLPCETGNSTSTMSEEDSTSTTTEDQTIWTTATTTIMIKECPTCPGTEITMETSLPMYAAPTQAAALNDTAMNAPYPYPTASEAYSPVDYAYAPPTAVPSAPYVDMDAAAPPSDMPIQAGSGSALTTSLAGVVFACVVVVVLM
ncbi:MAG: hypothetical protein M1816_005608 [Peltula sp. TS41687]|nr:MAG: hypothetical protein M1816_005608 [Peltula sp. TS41687]